MDLPFLLCCPIKVEARDFQILGPGETLVICLLILTDLCMIFPDILQYLLRIKEDKNEKEK